MTIAVMNEVVRPRPRVCSMCRRRIALDEGWFRCSVSACNAGRLKLTFCSTACFERHIPTARHRKASCIREADGG
jgi:hypothetical protein